MSSDDALKKAKSFYQKARDQYMIIEGNNDLDIEEMEIKIGRIESMIRRINDFQGEAEDINLYRKKYDHCAEYGNDVHTIDTGIQFASVLFRALRFIEAERFLTKLVATSHCVHGPDHNCTVKSVSLLKDISIRRVALKSEQSYSSY